MHKKSFVRYHPKNSVCIHSYQCMKVSLSFTSLSLIVFRSLIVHFFNIWYLFIIHFHNFHSVHTITLLTLQKFVYFVFYFFHSNRFVQKCDSFLFKILNTKLHTHFLRRCRTKRNMYSTRE
jgi:hypothetical protein